MNVNTSPEFFINMKSYPKYDATKSFADQNRDVQQFWIEEMRKVKYGITINGVKIHPWMYWHLNYWPMILDKKINDIVVRSAGLPNLRDNDWLFHECILKAQEEHKGIAMFGTRRFGKALLNTELVYTAGSPKMIKDVKIGDNIYDDEGELSRVKGVYPQGIVDIYKITFEDGREIRCCGDHLWKITKDELIYSIHNTKYMYENKMWNRYGIPLTKAIQGIPTNLAVSPLMLGNVMASYLMYGIEEEFVKTIYEKFTMMQFMVSTEVQRKYFADSFIRTGCGIETGYDDVVHIQKNDMNIIRFVQKMLWGLGHYAKYENNKLIISRNKKTLCIDNIEYIGKGEATCIEIENYSKLFLTTNYIVTHNTSVIASWTGWNATMFRNGDCSIIGGSDKDIRTMTRYIEFGLDNIHPVFKFSRLTTDWEKGVELGSRLKDGTKEIFSTISIFNVNMGKKGSIQKVAGPNPTAWVLDESGKFDCIDVLNSAKPSFDTEYGIWRCIPIITGTNSVSDTADDMEKIMSHPEIYNFIVMDWKLLHGGEEYVGKKKHFGIFVPGHMSLNGIKEESTLGEFLKMPNDKKLCKIPMKVTNWEASKQKLESKREEMRMKNRETYIAERFNYPLCIEDCFQNTAGLTFPTEIGKAHFEALMESGNTGLRCNIHIDKNGKFVYHECHKEVAGFPFEGGNIDAPVIIYEPPIEGIRFSDNLYCGGLDYYKVMTSGTSSLGTVYIVKRMHNPMDQWGYRIVASYASRPTDMNTFYTTTEALQDGYGAKILMENADIGYQQYLSSPSKNRDYMLLVNGEDVARTTINPNAKQNNKIGLVPSVRNQEFVFKLVWQYCWMEFDNCEDNDGVRRVMHGIELIPDPWLVKEIIEWTPGLNVDRIIAFGHALAYMKYLDDMSWMPKTPQEREREEEMRAHNNVQRYRSPYIMNNRSWVRR